MKNFVFLILTICLSIAVSRAQIHKASDYFPLQIGNVWEYDHPYQTQLQLFKVISDTIIEGNIFVYKVQRRSKLGDGPWLTGAPYYYHYNPDSIIIYRDDFIVPQELYTGLPVIDTGNNIGDRWQYLIGDCLCTFAVTDTGSASIFNKILPWLEVNTIDPEYDSLVIDPTFHWRYVSGIGPTEIGIENTLGW